MSGILSLHELDVAFGIWPTGLDNDGLTEGVFNSAKRIADEWRTETARILQEGHFSPTGLQAHLISMCRTEMGRLEAAANTQLTKVKKERDALLQTLQNLPTGKLSDVEAVEIRAALLALKEPSRQAAVFRALEDGEVGVINAILTAASFMREKLLPVGITIEMLRDRWAQGQDPATARRLSELETAISRAEGAVQKTREIILSTPGLDRSIVAALSLQLGMDPVAKMAGKRAAA